MTNKSNNKRKQTIVTNSPECQVCGEIPAGWHCGTITCEACKKFFLRKLNDVTDSKCTNGSNVCVITKSTRTNCQSCRFNRCLSVGMKRQDEVIKEEGTERVDYNGIRCHVCLEAASGLHFGAITCEGCKGFFRRSVNENKIPHCENEGKCDITNSNRNSCRSCRFDKCIEVGMDLNSIKMGRQSNLYKMQLREVAKHNSLVRSASALKSVPISIRSRANVRATPDIQIEDDLEPVYRDLIKEIFLAHQKSLETTDYKQDIASPIRFLDNNFQTSKTFLESIQFYREFDESDRKLILTSSIHPMRLIQILTDSNSNYIDILEDLSAYLPTFCHSKINDDLTSLCELIRELKLDSKEIMIYKAHLAFHSVDIRKSNKNAKRLKEIQTILLKTLQRFLFARRNENESSLMLIQLMDIIQEISFDLKSAFDNDLKELGAKKAFIFEYNLLKQYS